MGEPSPSAQTLKVDSLQIVQFSSELEWIYSSGQVVLTHMSHKTRVILFCLVSHPQSSLLV